MPNFHPDTSLLNDYTAGSLATSLSIAVKAHLEMCPECRRQVSQLESAGAYFLESSEYEISKDLFSKLMHKIESSPVRTDKSVGKREAIKSDPGLPVVVQKLIKKPVEGLNWRKLNKKLRFTRVRTGDKVNELSMYYINAGGKVPQHTHKSDEITLVLKGSFSDDDGVYRKGDFIVRTIGEKHSISATQNEDCLCLAVQEKPIAFTGLFRLLNPLLKVEPA